MVVQSSRRLGLLRRSPSFGLLFLATAGSSFGTYLAAIALTVDVYDRTGSGEWVAALLIADFLPIVLIGLLLGPLVDRLSRRRLMIASDLVRLGVFAALPFVNTAAGIVALAGVAGIATGFFRPAVYAGLPNLVPDEELTNANSLLQTVETLAWMIGPVLGGLMLTAWGPSVPYAVNAVTFLVSAGLVAAHPGAKPALRGVADAGVLARRLGRRAARAHLARRCARFSSSGTSCSSGARPSTSRRSCSPRTRSRPAISASGRSSRRAAWASRSGAISRLRRSARSGSGGTTRARSCSWAWGGEERRSATRSGSRSRSSSAGAAGNGAAIICNQILVQRGAPDRFRGRALATIMSTNYGVLGSGDGGGGRPDGPVRRTRTSGSPPDASTLPVPPSRSRSRAGCRSSPVIRTR